MSIVAYNYEKVNIFYGFCCFLQAKAPLRARVSPVATKKCSYDGNENKDANDAYDHVKEEKAED